MVVSHRHPGGVPGTFIGGVGGHDHFAVGHKTDGGVELAGTDGPVLGDDHILHPEQLFDLFRVVVIGAKPDIARSSDLRSKAVVEFSVRTYSGIPDGIVGMAKGIAVLADACLTDDPVVL